MQFFLATMTLATSLLLTSASAAASCSTTGKVVCLPIKTGTLVATDSNGHERYGAFEGSKNQVGKDVLDLGFYGGVSPAQQFTFEACASQYTGYTPVLGDTTTFYGHLVTNQTACVTAAPFPFKNYFTSPTAANCSRADDASQLAQTWSLTIGKSATGAREYQLKFIGARKSDPPTANEYGFHGIYAAESPVSALVPFLFYAPPSSIVNGQEDDADVYTFKLA
ncbi:hypothetical protein CF319_g609 [Tilletia indica]|nr:hypothetical protein CF319_g609 [Tilletia indica]